MIENVAKVRSEGSSERKSIIVAAQTKTGRHVTWCGHMTTVVRKETPFRVDTCGERRFTAETNGKMGRKPKASTYGWTNEKEEQLIRWWEETEYLYNLQCRDYRDTAKKQRAIESIAVKIGTTGEGLY